MAGLAIQGLNPSSAATIEIELWTGGNPNAGSMLHDETFNIPMYSGTQFNDFIFSTPVSITSGNQYHIKVYSVSGNFNNNVATSGNPYPGGTYYYNFGFWQPFSGDEDLVFRTYMAGPGSELVYTANNELGIGVSSPTDNLHVAGSVRFENIVGAPTALLQVDNTGVVSTTNATAVGNWTENAGDVYRTSGNVGIGTTSAGVDLVVTDTRPVLALTSSASNNGMRF